MIPTPYTRPLKKRLNIFDFRLTESALVRGVIMIMYHMFMFSVFSVSALRKVGYRGSHSQQAVHTGIAMRVRQDRQLSTSHYMIQCTVHTGLAMRVRQDRQLPTSHCMIQCTVHTGPAMRVRQGKRIRISIHIQMQGVKN